MLALPAAAVLITFADFHPALREQLRLGSAAEFDAWIAAIEKDTAQRLAEGEDDHRVFYMLQSREFTAEPRLEPALSAREWHEGGGRIPESAARRIAAYQRARGVNLEPAYRRAMAFLYDKEFQSRGLEGAARRDYVAALYQKRGHSTDTSPSNVRAMLEGLALITKQHAPGFAPRRVLVIGPGLDWAPRTGHRDDPDGPRTYQPEALRKALGERAAIHCIDINPRVVEHIGGKVQPGISAEVANILTQRPREAVDEPFDLVIATNVLLYFNARELALAVNNIAALVAPGGWFLHNDPRGEMESYTAAVGLTLEDARMVRLSETRALFDTVALHRRPAAR